MTHKALQNAVIQWLDRRFGHHCRHFNILGGIGCRRGVPDLLCCIRGTFVAVEVKTASAPTVSKEQRAEIAAIIDAGGRAGVVRSLQDLELLVSGIEPQQVPIGRARAKC
jgi:hypothetical protein